MKGTSQVSSETKLEDEAKEPGFHDWARFVSFQPQLYFRPQDLLQLKSFLEGVQKGPFKPGGLRVLGGLHSCSEICVSDTIIDTSDLPKTIEFAPDNSTVTVTANWHLHDFLLALSLHGKSLSATGGTDKQTLAGLISTDTAPASAYHALYDLLEWVEYLTIGEDGHSVIEKHLSKNDPDFPAVVCSLGVIGILTRVQFRLIDQLYFETIQKVVALKDILTDLTRTSQEYDFWRIDWIPDTDQGLLWAAKKIPQADPEGDYPTDQSENILRTVFNTLDKLESAGPLLDNSMRLLYSVLTKTYGEIRVSGPLRNMLPVDRRAPLHVAMAEWSFDPADLERLLESLRDYFKQNRWPNLPIEIELTKTDNYFMSPWNWPDLDYIVKFNFMYLTDVSQALGEKELIIAHLHGLWQHLLQAKIPFKAHWGKINFMDHAFVSSHYQLNQFAPFIRSIFINPYIAQRLMVSEP